MKILRDDIKKAPRWRNTSYAWGAFLD